ncbi:hypothetical protein XBO1_2530007 [Xenorhabdus bovienii str. oregonense]|uniref:Uncharacterized protein n=1 Tax=Xenorhabdus bovienii str. oregonense TaxID=1398202 RepID=A0A077P8Y3_XENBV|nr:hypothetical protein XBO1_2530007 [Xenorhabdus bovienii str. oregonense]
MKLPKIISLREWKSILSITDLVKYILLSIVFIFVISILLISSKETDIININENIIMIFRMFNLFNNLLKVNIIMPMNIFTLFRVMGKIIYGIIFTKILLFFLSEIENIIKNKARLANIWGVE